MKTVSITLVQGESRLFFSTELQTNLISEISGTLSGKIIALMVRAKKYKMNLGFSFNKKFDVEISIDGQSANGTETILNGLTRFGITLKQDIKSVENFHGFINDLVVDIVTGRNVIEGELDEMLELFAIELN